MIIKPGASERLWLDVFGDTAEYTNLIFERVIAPDLSFSAEIGGVVVSQACGVPYAFCCGAADGKTAVRGVYLCGLATHPEWRGRGLVSMLTDHLLERANKENFDFAFLIPASESLVKFYENRGWKQWILRHDFIISSSKLFFCTADNFIFSEGLNLDFEAGEWWRLYQENLAFSRGLILDLDEEQFKVAVEENIISGGRILTACLKDGTPVAILFCNRDEAGRLFVQYCVGRSDAAVMTLIGEAMRREGVTEMVWRLCSTDPLVNVASQIVAETELPQVYAMIKPLTPKGERICNSAAQIHLMLD